MSDKLNFKDFVQWSFYGLISVGGYLALGVVKDVNLSIEKLNTNVAVIIERTVSQRRDLDRIEVRVDRLEVKRN